MKEYSSFYKNIEVRIVDQNNIGIFTKQTIAKGEIIEKPPFIIEKNKPITFDKHAIAHNSYWIILLGYGSLYRAYYKNFNAELEIPESVSPNDDLKKYVTIRANQRIEKGEEIILNAAYFGLDVIDLGEFYSNIFIDNSPISGRGVFAGKDFSVNERIEIVYFLIDQKVDNRSSFRNYFLESNSEGQANLMLGYGSLYNHADEPNAKYQLHPYGLDKASVHSQFIEIIAINDIRAGSEITIHYTDKYWEDRKIEKV